MRGPFLPSFAAGSVNARLLASVASALAAPELAGLVSRGWLAACSGGADSTALLLASAAACAASGARLEVACVDHGLRSGAAGDVAHVAALCDTLGLTLHVGRLEWEPDARPGENELRDARYAFFARTLRERGLGGVLLGHTLEDQAETLLLHLIRGTGPRGLSGMRPVDGDRVRPLLDWRRAALRDFLRACGVAWREDETNEGDAYLRNRVRHGLLEAMTRENPRATEALARTAGLVRLEHDALVELAEEALAGRTIRLPGLLESWPLSEWWRHPPGLRTILLRRWWRLLCPSRGELPAAAVLEVAGILASAGAGIWDWPGPVRLVADRGLLVLVRPDQPLPEGLRLELALDSGGAADGRLRFVRPGDRLAREDGTTVRCKKLLEDVPRGLRPYALALADAQDRVHWLQYTVAGGRLSIGDVEIPVTV